MVAVQVLPPSLLQAAFEGPIAVQVVGVLHATPSIIEFAPVGAVALDHVFPPSLDVKIVAAVEPYPMATQSDVDGHETAVICPTPAGIVAGVHVAPPSSLKSTD